MAYEVLARKWRPQTFADVIGQGHITRTLQNAIQRQRVGHAYLFVGSRGIGKTTSARIFAKALNCLTPTADDEGHIEPCCECSSCREVAAGNCLDVLEIDGASNNGVEHIRELRETVQYSPTNGRQYKVYIIDEVHMLTPGAWNALLKTLEEPPSHVKFLFATTEAHKVLPTILSRCQRFDLKRLSVPLIVSRLRSIADGEGIYVTDDALTIIARAADGGMRDAQSSFDQIIAFCGGDSQENAIGEQDVIEVFGLTSYTELQRLAVALLNDDAGQTIAAIHDLADKGRNLERFYADVLQYLRNVMVYQVVEEPQRILDLSESESQDIASLANQGHPEVVQRLVAGLLENDGSIRYTLNKRVFLEATFLKVMRDAHAIRLDDLLKRLKKLRENGDLADLDKIPALESKPAVTIAPKAEGAAKPAAIAPEPKAPAPASAPTPKAAAPTPEPPPVAPPPAPKPEPVAETPVAPEPEPEPEPVVPVVPTPEPEPEPEPEPAPEPAAPEPEPAVVEEERTPPWEDEDDSDDPPPPQAEEEAADDSEETSESEEDSGPSLFPGLGLQVEEDDDDEAFGLDASTILAQAEAATVEEVFPASELIVTQQARETATRLWESVSNQVHDSFPEFAEHLDSVVPLSLHAGELRLGVPQALLSAEREVIKRFDTQKRLNSLLAEFSAEEPIRLRFYDVIVDFDQHERERRRQLVSTMDVWKRLEQNEFVRGVVALFEGQIVDVRG